MTSFVGEASEKKDLAENPEGSVAVEESKTVSPVASTSMTIPLPGLARGSTGSQGELKPLATGSTAEAKAKPLATGSKTEAKARPSVTTSKVEAKVKSSAPTSTESSVEPSATTSKREAKESSPAEEVRPIPGKITMTHRRNKPNIQSLDPDRWLKDLITAKVSEVINHQDDALKVLKAMAGPGCVLRDTTAVGDAVIRQLTVDGVLAPPKPTESTAALKPAQPQRDIKEIAAELSEALKTGDDDSITKLTKDDLARLERTNAFGRRVAQIASHALKLLKKAKAAATDSTAEKKDATKAEATPELTSAPMSSAPSSTASPVDGKDPVASATTTKTKEAYVPPPITVKLLKSASANRDKDESLDTSPAIEPMTPEQRDNAIKELRAMLPNISKADNVIAALEKLFTEVVDTQWMDQLRTEMVAALKVLDPKWEDLKPKAQHAFEQMFAKINEFAGMRGAIGEISAAAFALAQGRTQVSVSNEKLFLPDTFDTKTKKPKPGVDSQDVDITSNTDTDRFYTEAKYDMQTFLKKATVLMKDTGASTSADSKIADKSEDTTGKITTSTTSTEAGEEVTPDLDEDSDEKSSTATTELTEAKATSSATASYRPEQLEHYRKAATRTKTTKPRKKDRQMNLEIFIANRRGWPRLFMRNKLVKYMQTNKWHLYVDGIDLMASPGPFTQRVLELKKAFAAGRPAAASHSAEAKSPTTLEAKTSPTAEATPTTTGEAKASSTTEAKPVKSRQANEIDAFNAWLDQLSVEVGPDKFLALSVDDLLKAHPIN